MRLRSRSRETWYESSLPRGSMKNVTAASTSATKTTEPHTASRAVPSVRFACLSRANSTSPVKTMMASHRKGITSTDITLENEH
jgi:hypothetical protein